MDKLNTTICCGCLSIDRKMVKIDLDRKECFYRILDDLHLTPASMIAQLCWECNGRLKSYIKFKNQVRNAQICLQDVEKNLNTTSLSLLKTCDTSYQYECTEDIKPKILPTIYTETKVETETHSDHFSDSETLIEVKKKIKKPKQVCLYKEIELDDRQIENERKMAATNDSFLNALFKCEKCIEAFPNEEDLNDHNVNKHNKKLSIQCKICDCYFRTVMAYTYHMNKHTKRFQCKTCDLTFSSKSRVLTHHDRIHCLNMDYYYTDNEPALKCDADETINSSTNPYSCEFCDKSFRWRTSLRKHLETHSIERGLKRTPYCESCRLSFTTSANLRKHVKTSSKHQILLKLRKLNVQPTQNESPENQAQLEEIKCSITRSKQQFPCPQCDKRFQWRGNLLRHLKSHQARANGDLVCVPCNRTFSSIATYKQHMKISRKHVTENDFNYMCSDCGKKFANKTRLKDHINWEHLKNYVHTCSICQKVFKSHTSLYLHKQVVHKKETVQHLCDHCGKPFLSQAKLRCHIIALHSKETPYKCATCSARFNWHSCLSRHIRTVHSKEKINVIK